MGSSYGGKDRTNHSLRCGVYHPQPGILFSLFLPDRPGGGGDFSNKAFIGELILCG